MVTRTGLLALSFPSHHQEIVDVHPFICLKIKYLFVSADPHVTLICRKDAGVIKASHEDLKMHDSSQTSS